jgi:hypothetical protein
MRRKGLKFKKGIKLILAVSVADPDPEPDPVGSGPFCRIRIQKFHRQIQIRIQLW